MRQNLVAYVALFLALGSGLAYAGSAMIGGNDIKPDSISVPHLNLPVAMYDTYIWRDENRSGDGAFDEVTGTEVAIKDAGGDLFVTGTLEAENGNADQPQQVHARVLLGGKTMGDPLTFYLAPGATDLAPITFTQTDVSPGDYRLSVEVKADPAVKVTGGGIVSGILP